MLKSSRKKLIAIGCSFTEHYLTLGMSPVSPDIDHDFPRWPEHLSNMLDMECVNLGRHGAGNDYILAKTVDATLKEKNIGLVVLMWSEWRRVGFQRFRDSNKWTHAIPHDVEDWKKPVLEKQNKFHATRNTLRTFIHAEKILSDIPYMFIQGTENLSWTDEELEAEVIVELEESSYGWSQNQYSRRISSNEILISPYLDYIENNISDKFIGWPIMSEIGGYCINDILNKEDPSQSKFRISRIDSHPNAAGHKFIAEFLYEQYKEIYNEH